MLHNQYGGVASTFKSKVAQEDSSMGNGSQDLHAYLEDYCTRYPEDVFTLGKEDLDGTSGDGYRINALVLALERQQRFPVIVAINKLGVPSVVTNVFASRERIARLLNTDIAGIHGEFQRAARNLLPLAEVATGSVSEVIKEGDEVDLGELPTILHFPGDRGPYLTSGILVAEDPETGVGNLSYHRCVAHSKNELATSLHSRRHVWSMLRRAEKRGEKLPVAVVIGGHPLFMLAAAARVGPNVDEREIAGALLGSSLRVIRTPHYGIRVPADAEIVLEGYIDPSRHVDEGPFGEFTGYYSNRSTNNAISVETILRRSNPILLDVAASRSSDHLTLSRLPRESEQVEALFDRFPAISKVHYPASGVHFHCFVAMKPQMAGEARQVALALLGWDPYLKLVVVVDDDIDVENDSEVLWAIATRSQATKDVFMVGNLPGMLLDPSSGTDGTTARMAIDATRAVDFEGVTVEAGREAMDWANSLVGRTSLR